MADGALALDQAFKLLWIMMELGLEPDQVCKYFLRNPNDRPHVLLEILEIDTHMEFQNIRFLEIAAFLVSIDNRWARSWLLWIMMELGL